MGEFELKFAGEFATARVEYIRVIDVFKEGYIWVMDVLCEEMVNVKVEFVDVYMLKFVV